MSADKQPSVEAPPDDWAIGKRVALRAALASLAAGGAAALIREILRRGKEPTEELPVPGMPVVLPMGPEFGKSSHWLEEPRNLPLLVAGVGGGLMAGYGGVDWLLDKLRKREMEKKLERARQEFEEAMLADTLKDKTAAARFGQAIDRLYDSIEKRAEDAPEEEAGFWDWLQEKGRLYPGGPSLLSPGFMAGIGLAGSGTLWWLVHNAAKRYFERQDPEKIKMRAYQQLRRMRHETMPEPVMFALEQEGE